MLNDRRRWCNSHDYLGKRCAGTSKTAARVKRDFFIDKSPLIFKVITTHLQRRT